MEGRRLRLRQGLVALRVAGKLLSSTGSPSGRLRPSPHHQRDLGCRSLGRLRAGACGHSHSHSRSHRHRCHLRSQMLHAEPCRRQRHHSWERQEQQPQERQLLQIQGPGRRPWQRWRSRSIASSSSGQRRVPCFKKRTRAGILRGCRRSRWCSAEPTTSKQQGASALTANTDCNSRHLAVCLYTRRASATGV